MKSYRRPLVLTIAVFSLLAAGCGGHGSPQVASVASTTTTAVTTAPTHSGLIAFSQCMRGHGVSRFPDPTAQGELSVEMVQAQGVDVHSPAVLHTVQTCLPASHGAL